MKAAVLVTGADLAPQAVDLLAEFKIVYAGKTPGEDALVALCLEHDPVGIIVRYGRITSRIIEAASSLKVISKHGSGIDTIDVAAAEARFHAAGPVKDTRTFAPADRQGQAARATRSGTRP